MISNQNTEFNTSLAGGPANCPANVLANGLENGPAQLLLYKPAEGGLLDRFMSGSADGKDLRLLLDLAVEKGFSGCLWKDLITDFLLTDEDPFTLSCELREPDPAFKAAAAQDLFFFYEQFRNVPEALKAPLFMNYPKAGKGRQGGIIRAMADKLDAAAGKEEFAEVIFNHLRENGCGVQSLCGAFRTAFSGEDICLEPVFDFGNVRFTQLIGCEQETAKLKANTEAFLDSQPCNNVLLYGDSGSGKSTSIKALENEYQDRGLRLIELQKEQFRKLPDLLSMLKNRAFRYILYIDDLSFEEFETDYKLMKSVIEGGMEPRPENVLIYATSNRRHLIKETWNDRSDMEKVGDLHRSDSTEEKLSLAGRFGLAINYSSPGRKNYHRIVLSLADERGLQYDEEELLRLSDAWEIRHGGLSGRTAKQFVDSLPQNAPIVPQK